MGASHDDVEQEEPFLGKSEDARPNPRPRKFKHTRFLCLGLLLLSVIAHALLFALWVKYGAFSKSATPKLYSPFENVLSTKVEKHLDNMWDDSIYVGPPSKKLDGAWHQIQRVIGMRLSPDEAGKINLTEGIQTKDGDHVVETGFIHNIHCLRYIYEILHRDTYVHALNVVHGDPEVIGLEHAYHCIEALRDSVTCRPDLNLYGIKWSDEEKSNLALHTGVQRECVDFESIVDVTLERKVGPDMYADAEDSFLGPMLKATGGERL